MDDHSHTPTTPEHPQYGLAATAYCGPRGEDYHNRNRERLQKEAVLRRVAIRTLLSPYLTQPGMIYWPWLEVGCGEGYNLYYGDVGVDIDPRPLSYLPPKQMIPILSNSDFLPFPANSFHVSFCIGLLMHQVDGEWQQTLAEMARVTSHLILIGEYMGETETPEPNPHWEGLLYRRPYTPPLGWELIHTQTNLKPFDSSVTFQTYKKHHNTTT